MALLRATQSALERTRDHKFFTYLVWVISQWCRWTVCVCMRCWLRKCTVKGCHWLRQWLRIFRWCFMLARSAIIILPSSSTHPSHWPLSTPLICSTAQHNCTTSLKLQYLSFRWLLSSVPDINESCLFALIHSLIHSQSTLPGTSIDKWSVCCFCCCCCCPLFLPLFSLPFSFPCLSDRSTGRWLPCSEVFVPSVPSIWLVKHTGEAPLPLSQRNWCKLLLVHYSLSLHLACKCIVLTL